MFGMSLHSPPNYDVILTDINVLGKLNWTDAKFNTGFFVSILSFVTTASLVIS